MHWPAGMDDDEFPPRPTPAEAALLIKRQRGRNIAMMVALFRVAALFFAITLAKLSGIK
jgi:hypothetical protein